MNFLLDTNIIIEAIRNKTPLSPNLIKQGVALSIITLAELIYGSYKSEHSEKNKQLINNFILEFEVHILTLEHPVVDYYGQLRVKLEKDGNRIDNFDLLIAATAIANNVTLVTKNLKHFNRVPNLKLYLEAV